jgi:hypothetical protein
VPFSLFSENEHLPDGSRPPVWLAVDESRPRAVLRGPMDALDIRAQRSRKANELFAFLTTEPNAEARSIPTYAAV